MLVPLFAGFFFIAGQAFAKVDKVTLSSPFAPLVMPMAYMVENGLLNDVTAKTKLKIWNTPGQLPRTSHHG